MYPETFENDLDVSLDLTPVIDVVFVLLIFIILTATFSRPVLEVALARADSASVREVAQEKLTVTITEDSRILFEDDAVLPEAVAARLKGLPKDALIIFNVDKAAQFGLFVLVLDAAKSQGRSNFMINAGSPDGKLHAQPGSDK